MAVLQPTNYELSANISVKWTATQLRSLDREYPLGQTATDSTEYYVTRTYLQFLWLPESIMSIRYLVPSFRRITHDSSTSRGAPHSDRPHPLHDLLRPLLLTPRTASQKYHNHINQIIEQDGGSDDLEENLMWYVIKNEKTDEGKGEAVLNESTYEADEKWKNEWLGRMERREVQVQILLHFLLLSLPGPLPSDAAAQPATTGLPAHLSSTKRGKRKHPDPSQMLSMEDRLESFMDKLSMWQLIGSLDEISSHPNKNNSIQEKGKQKVTDERDWMQVFCEDIVERQFKENLPDLCALLHTKVFPASPFGDDDDILSLSPPSSPRQKSKHLKSSTPGSLSRTSSRVIPSSRGPEDDLRLAQKLKTPQSQLQSQSQIQTLQRDRSRSLSVSLEEERARSRSLSVGPGGLRKRMLAREVSMTTGFKNKTKAREKEQTKALRAAGMESRKAGAADSQAKAKDTSSKQGITLVAATPVKPKALKHKDGGASSEMQSQSQASSSTSFACAPRLPACDLSAVTEGDDDEDDTWTLPSSPDVLLLSSSSQGGWSVSEDEDEDDEAWDGDAQDASGRSQGRSLAAGTPTKSRWKSKSGLR